jgi:hypothetical protein
MTGTVRRRLASLSDGHWTAILFLGAFLPRLAIIVLRRSEPRPSEMTNVAWTFASRGLLGDPYGVPTGASAHVAPGYPVLLGLLMRAAGSRLGGVFVAQILSAMLISVVIALLPIVARRLRFTREAGILAAIVLIPPIFVFLETSSEWETPFLSAAMMLCLAVTLPLVFDGRFGARRGAAVGVLWGATYLLAPLMAPVFVAVHALAALRWRTRARELASYLATALVVSALVVAPYLVRIERQLHGFAFVRSNLGLELAVSNNDSAAVTLDDNIQRGRGMSTHPFQNPGEAARVGRLGELVYNRERMREAKGWIAAHPARFALLSLHRAALFWVPRSKRFYQRVLFALAVAGALGFVLTRGRWRRYEVQTLVVVSLAYSAIYAFVQTDPRYSYPLLWLHVLMAAAFALELAGVRGPEPVAAGAPTPDLARVQPARV